MLFIVQYKPTRPNFLNTITQEEVESVGEHFNYLKGLFAEGKARLIGRREDGDFGIAILDLSSLSEAASITNNDPVVKSGVFQATVGEFRVVMGTL